MIILKKLLIGHTRVNTIDETAFMWIYQKVVNGCVCIYGGALL